MSEKPGHCILTVPLRNYKAMHLKADLNTKYPVAPVLTDAGKVWNLRRTLDVKEKVNLNSYLKKNNSEKLPSKQR